MHIQARVPGPQTIYGAEMYGVWIAACPAQPGDSIVLDNGAAAQCVSKPPSPQSSDYDLHDAAYQLISTKALQVRWARGHRDPKKEHNLQDYQDKIVNKLANLAARAGSTMHPCRGLGSTTPADILLNNHVMPSPARKPVSGSSNHAPRSWYPRCIGRHGCRCARSTEISGVHGCGGHCDGQGMGHPGKPGRCCAHGVDSTMASQCKSASCHAPPSPGFGTFGLTCGRHGNRRQPSGNKRRPPTSCACAPACSSHTPFNDPSFQFRRTGGW